MKDNFLQSRGAGPLFATVMALVAITVLWTASQFRDAYKNNITPLDSATIEALNRINAMKECIEASTNAVKAYVAIDDIVYSRDDLIQQREIEDQMIAIIQSDSSTNVHNTGAASKQLGLNKQQLLEFEAMITKLLKALDIADEKNSSGENSNGGEADGFFPRDSIEQRLKDGIDACVNSANPEQEED